jgi:hypothetical protein
MFQPILHAEKGNRPEWPILDHRSGLHIPFFRNSFFESQSIKSTANIWPERQVGDIDTDLMQRRC